MEQIKAAFFDRDGTIIEDVNYLKSIDDIKIIQDAIYLIRYLQEKDYKIFVVTNQSGVARGYFDESFVIKTHEYLYNLLKQENIFIKKFYYCPHHESNAVDEKYLINCDCRKPKPGMFFASAKEFNINLSESLMFGDKLLDIEAGSAAGCKSFYIQQFFNLQQNFRLNFYKSFFE